MCSEIPEIVVLKMTEYSLVNGLYLAHLAIENDLARELALVLVEVLLVFEVYPDCRRSNWAIRGRRPGRRLCDEYRGVRRRHTDPGVQLLPSHAEFAPVFQVRVAAAHRGELIASPFIGALRVGRAGEARADSIHQSRSVFHDVRMADGLIADALIHAVIEILALGLNDRRRRRIWR